MDPTKNDEARRKLTDKGASLVASLKLRVSRLEATLRAKEAELARLHASAKATSLNELKIEAETYYQEVVRLRNQLNIVQQQQQQHQYYSTNQSNHQQQHPPAPPAPQHPPPPPQHNHHASHQAQGNATATTQPAAPYHSSTMRGKREGREGREAPQDKRGGGDGQESPTASLRHALVLLEEENARMGQQVSVLVSEKEKLTADLERVLGLTEEVKGSYEGLSRAELIREVERREAEVMRWESQHRQLTEALGRHSEQAGESSALLQARVSELQGREEEWKRERSSLQELINTLKDDRIFYKETAMKKDTELDGLRKEVQSLQQEVTSLQGAQRRRGERLPGSTLRPARPGASTASRSGSSSETHTTPTRRPRPSSARPPASGTRPQRHMKSSSEPRETPSPSRQRTPSQHGPRKLPVKSSSTRTASSSSTMSSPSQASPRKQPAAPPNRSGVVRQSRQPTPSSSLSSKSSTPTASPSKVPGRVTSSSASSPQHRSGLASPQLRNGTTRSSKQQNGVIGSPQHKDGVNASPKHRNGVIGSPRVKPGSPVKTPTPRSSSRSSTPSSQVRSSPSKVTASPRSPSKVPQPSPRGRKEAPPPPPQHIPRRQGSSGLSSTEEDERVLAEIIFQRDTDSSLEGPLDSPSSAPMARQRTVTLDTQEEEEEEGEKGDRTSLSSQRISSKEGEDGGGKEEEELTPGRRRRRKDKEIAETLDVLRSLLTGHLSRQQEVNHLLTRAPLLVGEGQGGSGGGQSKRSPRQAPEGAEGSGKSGLVRQGTFNVNEEGGDEEAEGSTALHATLDAHLTRTKGVRQLK